MATISDPLRIVHVTAPGPVGGLESVVRGLAIGHHANELRVEIIALLTPDSDVSPFLNPIEAAGVPIHRVVLPPRAYLRERRAVRRILQDRRPHVVHTHAHRADVLHAGVARKLGIATATTIHGASRVSWRSGAYEWIQFRLARRFDAVIAVSRPLAEELHQAGVPKERLWLCPNAWSGQRVGLLRSEARERLGLPMKGFVFGWVGRLIPIKGLDVLLNALGQLNGAPHTLSIIGDGPERERLRLLADTLGVRDRVRFHGRIDDAAQYYPAFDAFVLSSRSEGTPMVLFEAMAEGVPIIATSVGGVPDVVSQDEAILVPPEAPSDLAAALELALSGEGHLEAKAEKAGRRLDEVFGRDNWLARHEDIYRRISKAMSP